MNPAYFSITVIEIPWWIPVTGVCIAILISLVYLWYSAGKTVKKNEN